MPLDMIKLVVELACFSRHYYEKLIVDDPLGGRDDPGSDQIR